MIRALLIFAILLPVVDFIIPYGALKGFIVIALLWFLLDKYTPYKNEAFDLRDHSKD